ncbi:hypothetical protein LCGC14_0335110 [marine sediment metagenome]|uniref:Uncharacterized protein n=1 Tax=marine sediment metagenome TaxID=412755 RepID=A0A0F9WMZ1_9ZZZZ
MTDEFEQQEFYFVTTALPGPSNECVFVDVQTADGNDTGPEGCGADWEKHPRYPGYYRLGPFAKYGVRHVETQASFEAELRGKDAEIKILEARHAPALALHREVQEDRDRVLAELEKAKDERDTSIRAIAAMTPVMEKANEVLNGKHDEAERLKVQHEVALGELREVRGELGVANGVIRSTQAEVAGLRQTIDEEWSQAAHERRNLESQVVAARAGR